MTFDEKYLRARKRVHVDYIEGTLHYDGHCKHRTIANSVFNKTKHQGLFEAATKYLKKAVRDEFLVDRKLRFKTLEELYNYVKENHDED